MGQWCPPHWMLQRWRNWAPQIISSVVSFLSSVLGYVYRKECLNLTDSWEHWLSQEQRFLGNDKVQTLSNGSFCIVLQSLAIVAARTSRSRAASHASKHQAPAIRGIPGLHNNRGFSRPSLGCVWGWEFLAMVLRWRSSNVRMLWAPRDQDNQAAGALSYRQLGFTGNRVPFSLCWAATGSLLEVGQAWGFVSSATEPLGMASQKEIGVSD